MYFHKLYFLNLIFRNYTLKIFVFGKVNLCSGGFIYLYKIMYVLL